MSHRYRYESYEPFHTSVGMCECGLAAISHSTIAAKRLLDRKHRRQCRLVVETIAMRISEKMTVKELRQYARDNGMSSITRLTRKSELVEAIAKYLVTKGKEL